MRRVYALLMVVLLAACSASPAVTNVSPAEAKALLEQKESTGLFVLQTHEPFMGEIEQTDAVIEDWENVATHTDVLPKNKNTPILVYCRSGRMSAVAVEQLNAMGYTKLYDLAGGMNAWTEEGYELVNVPQ